MRECRSTLNTKILRDGWFVISFLRISVKKAKPLQALLEGGGEKGRDTCMIGKVAVRSECVPFHTFTQRNGWLVFLFLHVSAKNAKLLKP